LRVRVRPPPARTPYQANPFSGQARTAANPSQLLIHVRLVYKVNTKGTGKYPRSLKKIWRTPSEYAP
jgi:hypothetical protein